MNSIHVDLLYEIFSRLPTKSIGRCRCVCEQWRSILCSADFTEYFLTKSSTRPSLLFTMNRSRSNEFLFFSSPPQIQSKSSSLAAAAYFKLNLQLEFCGHAAGLFCFRFMQFIWEDWKDTMHHVICNPSIGQHVFLPKLKSRSIWSFLGFDPVDKVFKVFSPDSSDSSFAYILTLGDKRWRKIHFPLAHSPVSKGICINGSLYYFARENFTTYFIVCFDVRSEKFKLIQGSFLDSDTRLRLINYKGRLGVISWPKEIWDYRVGVYSRSKEEMRIRVLEDDEKHDWSEYAYTLPGDKFHDVECDAFKVSVAGVTATGEIVLMNRPNYDHPSPFYVFYFHPERNVIKRVEVQGFGKYGRVDAFVDHVDDLTFDIKSWQMDFLKFESTNKFDALCLLEDM